MLSASDQDLLEKIRKHLFDLHTEWADNPNDGHCKSNEGYIGLFLHYPNWFEATDYLSDKPEVGCEIYSYLFGPSRLHKYESLEEAWSEVSKWSYQS